MKRSIYNRNFPFMYTKLYKTVKDGVHDWEK